MSYKCKHKYKIVQQLPGAPEPEETWRWPASYLSIICFLYFCLGFTIFVISNCLLLLFYKMAFQLCSCATFLNELQLRKCSMVSAFVSQTTHRLSKYLQMYKVVRFFIFSACDFLKLNILWIFFLLHWILLEQGDQKVHLESDYFTLRDWALHSTK